MMRARAAASGRSIGDFAAAAAAAARAAAAAAADAAEAATVGACSRFL